MHSLISKRFITLRVPLIDRTLIVDISKEKIKNMITGIFKEGKLMYSVSRDIDKSGNLEYGTVCKYENFRLKHLITYKRLRIETHEHYEKGKLVMRCDKRNGVIDGLVIEYHPNEIVKKKYSMDRGTLDGDFVEFYGFGSIKELCKYKNGRKEGMHFYHDERGNLVKQQLYKEGKLLATISKENGDDMSNYLMNTIKLESIAGIA